MSKTIAILTLPIGGGYGGILQNYALQQALTKGGATPLTINLRKELSSLRLFLSSIKKMILSGNFFALDLHPKKNTKHRTELLQQFITKRINISERLTSEDQFLDYISSLNFDAVVIGSDQVWRPEYTPFFSPYLLRGVSKEGVKKYAFSASFGYDPHNLSKPDIQMMSTELRYFDGVSLREDDATEFCKIELGKKDSFTSLDPTMLLDMEDYNNLLSDEFKPTGNAFVYLLDSTKFARKRVQYVLNNLELKAFTCEPYSELTPLFRGLKRDQLPSIEQWLLSIKNADLIITDSFHCAVFSSIFKKPFICLENKNRGNSRFNTLKQYVIDDFRFSSYDDWDFDKIMDPFSDFTDLFKQRKEKTYEYLYKIINI